VPSGRAHLLKDVVVDRPRLLLVGINPGLRSGAVGHHFAGNGNPFWRLLHAARLTPVLIDYAEDQRLGELGIALTNLCPRTTRTAAELTRAEIARGRVVLAGKIAAWRPAVVALVGVSLYRMFFEVAAGPGPGSKRETISGARVFVVPNPSGLNASFPGFEDKLRWFKRLRLFVDRIASDEARRRRAKSIAGGHGDPPSVPDPNETG
jgi:TDG/mug DNA glycosylase family protein